MKKDAKAFAPIVARGTCIVLAFAGAFVAAAKPPANNDTVDNPAPIEPTKGVVAPPVTRGFFGDDGSIAGPVVLWDNGAIDTAEAMACTAPGTASTLQNTAPQCLNTFGFGLAAATLRLADDFTLTQCAQISEVEIYAYTTGATVPTVTGAVVTLHSGQPFCPSSSVIATVNATGASLLTTFTTTYRRLPTDIPPGTGCTRRIQRVRVSTPSFPVLPPGTYWLSWAVTGGNFCPPVTILGQQGKPGANARQSNGVGAAFVPLFDTGGGVACPIPAPGAPQDMPFVLKGSTSSCGPCPGDIVANGNVDVNDLLAVISTWGACPGCPPVHCPADIAPAAGDCQIDVNDLLGVISKWGLCPGPPPPPPQSTGACCTAGSCTVATVAACQGGGGTYFGDGVPCSATNGCSAPVNDECAGATPLPDGNTNVLTTLATNSADAAPSCAAIGRDVWFTLATVAGTSYTINTTGTGVGCANVGDTVLQVVAACGGAEIACNDDFAPGLLSSLTFLGDGSTVRVRLGTFSATGLGGSIVVNVSHTP